MYMENTIVRNTRRRENHRLWVDGGIYFVLRCLVECSLWREAGVGRLSPVPNEIDCSHATNKIVFPTPWQTCMSNYRRCHSTISGRFKVYISSTYDRQARKWINAYFLPISSFWLQGLKSSPARDERNIRLCRPVNADHQLDTVNQSTFYSALHVHSW